VVKCTDASMLHPEPDAWYHIRATAGVVSDLFPKRRSGSRPQRSPTVCSVSPALS